MSTRIKPPVTRTGRTHKRQVGKVCVYITVNRDSAGRIIEVFGKADNGINGHLENVCKAWSVAIQYGADVPCVIRHMRGDRTEPCGTVGQPSSIYDAVARVLEEENGQENEAGGKEHGA